MDGLEINEIYKSELERTARIDAEFYKKENLKVSAQLKTTDFHSVTEYFYISDGNHMSISDAFQKKGIPYYRGQDIYNVFIESALPICIDKSTFLHPHMTRSHLQSGDVLMSIVGAIVGNSALVSSNEDATCSCKLAIIRAKDCCILPEYLLIFIKTQYGQNQIQKFKRGTAQTGFLLEDFEQVLIPKQSEYFQNRIKSIVINAHNAIIAANLSYSQSEEILLTEIHYSRVFNQESAITEKTYSDSFKKTGRLDSEYYQPKYDALFETLACFNCKPLGGDNGIVQIKKSIEPGSEAYQEEGVPFVRVSDVNKYEIAKTEVFLDHNIVNNIESLYPKKDTILFSKDGSVGIAHKVEEDSQFVTSGALLHLTVRNAREVLPDYLTLVLNSPIVQLQAERDSNGAIIQHWKPSEIEQVVIPILDKPVQEMIAAKVQESFALRRKSKELLEYAKQAVEMAIEQGENAALNWLNSIMESFA